MAILTTRQPFQPRATKNPLREKLVTSWASYAPPCCKETGMPLPYPTDDLPDLLVASHEVPKSSIDISELKATQKGIAQILSSCDLEGLMETLRSAPLDSDYFALAYSAEQLFDLEESCANGRDNFRTVYFIRGSEEPSESIKAALKRLLDNHRKRIVVKKAYFSIIATYGQYKRGLQLVEKNVTGGWHFLVLADKNDVPSQLMGDMRFKPVHHLIVPKGVKFSCFGFSPFKLEQIEEDWRRHSIMTSYATDYLVRCNAKGVEPKPFDSNIHLLAACDDPEAARFTKKGEHG